MSRNNGNNSGFCQEGQSGYDRCQASCPLPYGFIPCVEPIDSCGRIGPTGATGPTGSRGETGPAGIRGESGPRGLPGERGPQGERGLQGIQGEQGQQGLRGERGIPGARGEQGLPGPRGPIAATIPFSIAGNGYGQGIQISTDEEGKPRAVNFAGFGEANSYQPLQLKPGEWDEGIITIDQGAHFPSSFVMPYDGTLRNVFAVFANREPMILPTGLLLRPFVCLATSDSTSLSFQILKETITYVEPYVGSEEEIPKYSLRTGSKTDLDLPLARGTLVVIMVGWVGEGENPEYSSLVSMSGGLFLD